MSSSDESDIYTRGQRMSSTEDATDLLIHTLDTLCAELVSGRGIASPRDGHVVRLESNAPRAVFHWYRRNRGKWAGQNRKEDVEAIAGEVDKEPPVLPAVDLPDASRPVQVVHLKRIRAHRFAGIHRYGSVDESPADFEVEIDNPTSPGVWVIQGKNGAGKTSILSAITWCLTGRIYRSQRPPEGTEHPVEVYRADAAEGQEEDAACQDISAVTPVPPSDVLEQLGGASVPLDTWVELTFVDSDGRELGTIRRSVTRSRRGGRIEVTKPDFSRFRLPPIALEIGTTMTGLLPYFQVGQQSDLGSAVAELTGIRPLGDLVKHARKSHRKLRRDLPAERRAEIAKLDGRYASEREELAQLVEEHQDIAPESPLPQDPADTACKDELEKLKLHFEAHQAQALAGAKAILGNTFDKSDPDARNDLIESIGPAIGATDFRAIAKLSSATRLQALGGLKQSELCSAESLIEAVLQQANELAELEKKKDIAARIRLYAKVANWVKEVDPEADDLTECPVCGGELKVIKNKTLYGWNISLGYICTQCPYWTGQKKRVPVRYVFILKQH